LPTRARLVARSTPGAGSWKAPEKLTSITSPRRARNPAGLGAVWFPVAAATALTALLGTIAADSRWLAALGGYVVRHGIPDFVPFASAPSDGWANVPVLGELAFHGLEALAGDRGLLIAQLIAVAVAFALLALDIRRAGASDSSAVLVLLVLIPADLAALAEIRSQLFSLALFPLLLVLVRREARSPSRRIWLIPPLLALWSNLHGAVLVGLAVAATYLVLDRARREPWVALGVLAAAVPAPFATPALWRTWSYYSGVLQNEAARRGVGLWAPLSLSSGLDLLFIVCMLVLAAAALRSRPALWELAVLAGLAVLTARSARGGVWLAFFAVTPAALGLGRGAVPRVRLVAPAVVALAGLAALGVVRGPHQPGTGSRLLGRALAAAGGTPILATELVAEQVALAGGRIWLGNPIDAFRRSDQRLYLDWLQGKPAGDAALRHAPRVVLARPRSAAQRRLAHLGALHEVARDAGAVLYVRRPGL
jgi:hypothetical protein